MEVNWGFRGAAVTEGGERGRVLEYALQRALCRKVKVKVSLLFGPVSMSIDDAVAFRRKYRNPQAWQSFTQAR
jgi:hypothetical protein